MNVDNTIADNPTINLRLHDSLDKVKNAPGMEGMLSSIL